MKGGLHDIFKCFNISYNKKMEFLIIIFISATVLIIMYNILKINLREIKELGMSEDLNKMTEKYPSNLEICKNMLKRVNNEKVKIEEDSKAESSLYIAISNKIFIANTKGSFTRIQTMAHECLHSVQDRKILLFNFIFSNIYLIYFVTIILLTIFTKQLSKMLLLNIFLLLSLTYYMVRAFLENDAMIKAKYLAKEYMEEEQISTQEEINEIVEGFTKINDLGIKAVNYQLFLGILIKVIIFSAVALIF